MPYHFLRCSILATASLTLLATIALAQAAAQATGPQEPTPRTQDGKPDFSGNWASGATQQNADLDASLKALSEAVPFQPWTKELYLERNENLPKGDPEDHCVFPGVRRIITSPYLFRIVQTPKLIVIQH